MSKPRFTKRVIGQLVNDTPPAQMNLLLAAGDIDGNGLLDLALCGRNGKMVWLENKGKATEWKQHLTGQVDKMECGGSLYDLTGNGYLDIINGSDWRLDEIYWWENPGIPGEKWMKRMIAKTGNNQFHDTIIGDVTGDGVISLAFTNQFGGTNIYRLPLPQDPRVSPWPNLEVIATGKTEPNPHRNEGVQPEEGLAVGDVDGDGKNEVVCGTHWYKYIDKGWQGHRFAAGYITTKVAIGDIDGDGRNEIVLSEGDPCVYGRIQGGKLAWFKPKSDITEMWNEHVLADGLLDAHTLQLGDICGNGYLDILVGEVGVTHQQVKDYRASKKSRGTLFERIINRNPLSYAIKQPRILVFENDGRANFTQHLIDKGTGIHDGLLADVLNRGVLDIVGKPLHGPEKWNVCVWYNNRGCKPL